MSALDARPDDNDSLSSPLTHELLVSFLIALIFGAAMVAQEHGILRLLVGDASMPYLIWRSLWPLSLIGISLLLPMRSRILFLAGSGLLWTGVVVADHAYFRFFGSVTSLVSLGTIHQLSDVHESVFQVLNGADGVYAIAFITLSLVAILPKRLLQGAGEGLEWRLRKRASLAVFAVVFLFAMIARVTPIYEDTHHLGRDKWVMPADHWGSKYSYAGFAGAFGLYNYHAVDLWNALTDDGSADLSDERIAEIDSLIDRRARLNAEGSPYFGLARGRRVVMIQLEAIVHWAMTAEHEGVRAMPFLFGLTKSHLSFDYMMDVTAIGRTSDAEFAVMSGILPDVSKPNSFVNADRAGAYLPRALGDLGYSTASYHGYDIDFWNRSMTHPTYGFERSYFRETYDQSRNLGLGVPDDVVYDYLVEELAGEKEPSFSFMISLSSHHPFVYSPKEYRQYFSDLKPNEGWGLLGPYLQSARFADDQLAEFFENLKAQDLLEDTLFVIYGDHDAGGLLTTRTLPTMSPYAHTAGEERVPFLIVMPGLENELADMADAFPNSTGGLHDVFPTVMHLLGEPVPSGVLGTHLFVPDGVRDPVPMPTFRADEVLFAFRQCLIGSHGSACIDPHLEREPIPADEIPTLEVGVSEQLLVRDLLSAQGYWTDRAARQSDEGHLAVSLR